MKVDEIKEQALREIAEEDHRKRIDECKARLRSKRSFWERVFPFTITITRR